jgi:hypothetical protein
MEDLDTRVSGLGGDSRRLRETLTIHSGRPARGAPLHQTRATRVRNPLLQSNCYCPWRVPAAHQAPLGEHLYGAR